MTVDPVPRYPSLEDAEALLRLYYALVMDGCSAPAGGPASLEQRFQQALEQAVTGCGGTPAAAAGLARALAALRADVAADVDAALRNDPAARSRAEVEACYPGVHAVAAYRLAHRALHAGVPVLPRLLDEAAHRSTGVDINPGARIGRAFFIDHGTGTVIGETSDIGDRVTLYHGVTLGAISFSHDDDGRVIRVEKRHPTLEDDVTVYCNATILGGETVVGRGCIVGAKVLLTHSVPPDSVIMGSPPRLHQIRRTPQA